MLRCCFIFCFLTLAGITYSQEEKQPEIITSIAEQLAEEGNDPQLSESFSDLLRILAEEPVDINSADENEIGRLFFLTGFQVKMLCDYVRKNGKILSIYEIANLPGFDEENTRIMVPFVTLAGGQQHPYDSVQIRHSFIANAGIKPGPHDPVLLGSPFRLSVRYKFTAGKITGGMTMEKDAGEKLLSGRPPMPDFYSANIQYRGAGFIRKFIAGDFTARFGQGVALKTGPVTGSSLSIPGNLSGRDEIRPYSSTDENNFFRGAGIMAVKNKSTFNIFFSANKIDAVMTDSISPQNISVSGLYRSGIHNTASSVLKRDNMREYAAGISVSRSFKNMNAGLLVFCDRFSLPFTNNRNDLTRLYDFSGQTNILYSAYYSLLTGRFIFSGEFCTGGKKRIGTVQNIVFHPSDRLTIYLTGRNFSPGFAVFHGRGLLSGSSTLSEKGLAGGFIIEAARFFFINAGADLRIYPWLRYLCNSPSSAVRHELRLRYLPNERINFEAFYTYRYSVHDMKREAGMAFPGEEVTQSVKLQAKYSLSERYAFTTRIDFKNFDPGGKKGILLLQDIVIRCLKFPVTVWLRYCIFSAEVFDTALYTWENDLLYNFSIPALYGKGSRMYMVVKWHPARNLEFRIKYGITSSKNNGIKTNFNDEFKFQVAAKF